MNLRKAAKVRAGFEEQQLKWFAKSKAGAVEILDSPPAADVAG